MSRREHIDERIVLMEVKHKSHVIVLIGSYTPTDNSEVAMKKEYLKKLANIL